MEKLSNKDHCSSVYNSQNTAVQLLSVSNFVTPWIATRLASVSSTISRSLLKLMSTESWCHAPSHPLSPLSPPVLNLSQHQGLFHELALCIRWPKYWNISFGISPFDEYLGLISCRIDWFDLLASLKTLKSLFQHHNYKPSILQHSAFFMVQLSHQYMITGKTTALIIQAFVSKVMSLLFNMLSRFVIAFFIRSKKFVVFFFFKFCGCSHENHYKLWKILQEMGIPDHLTCLLRNLYAGQEATVRTGHGKTD